MQLDELVNYLKKCETLTKYCSDRSQREVRAKQRLSFSGVQTDYSSPSPDRGIAATHSMEHSRPESSTENKTPPGDSGDGTWAQETCEIPLLSLSNTFPIHTAQEQELRQTGRPGAGDTGMLGGHKLAGMEASFVCAPLTGCSQEYIPPMHQPSKGPLTKNRGDTQVFSGGTHWKATGKVPGTADTYKGQHRLENDSEQEMNAPLEEDSAPVHAVQADSSATSSAKAVTAPWEESTGLSGPLQACSKPIAGRGGDVMHGHDAKVYGEEPTDLICWSGEQSSLGLKVTKAEATGVESWPEEHSTGGKGSRSLSPATAETSFSQIALERADQGTMGGSVTRSTPGRDEFACSKQDRSSSDVTLTPPAKAAPAPLSLSLGSAAQRTAAGAVSEAAQGEPFTAMSVVQAQTSPDDFVNLLQCNSIIPKKSRRVMPPHPREINQSSPSPLQHELSLGCTSEKSPPPGAPIGQGPRLIAPEVPARPAKSSPMGQTYNLIPSECLGPSQPQPAAAQAPKKASDAPKHSDPFRAEAPWAIFTSASNDDLASADHSAPFHSAEREDKHRQNVPKDSNVFHTPLSPPHRAQQGRDPQSNVESVTLPMHVPPQGPLFNDNKEHKTLGLSELTSTHTPLQVLCHSHWSREFFQVLSVCRITVVQIVCTKLWG